MYAPLVILHSWLRWVVLLAALVALVRAVGGRINHRPWQPADNAAGRWFVIGLDLQVLIGLLLYLFLSPYTMSAWNNMAETMRDPLLRFMAIEHPAGMIVGVALAHIGRVRIRKTADPARKHLAALIFFGLALVIIAGSIPWPFMAAGRPLFRF